MILIAFDPSGNFVEDKGTTGWTLFKIEDKEFSIVSVGNLRAEDYESQSDYYKAHINLIQDFKVDEVVCEDFRLYATHAMRQVNSRMETSKLIGIIEFHCMSNNIFFILQPAAQVTPFYKDEYLVHRGIIHGTKSRYYAGGVQINRHIRDSIRHAYHRYRIKLKKGEL